MSKSLGNVLDPDEVIDRFGADALRYYCFREVSFGQDGSVSAAGFEARYETELANEYGNLASRTLAMIDRYRDGTVPEAEPDPQLAADFEGAADRVRDLLDRAELTQALEEIWKLVRRLNQYVEESRPWDLAKDEAQAERLDVVLYNLAEGAAGDVAAARALPARQCRALARTALASRAGSWPSWARERAASGSRSCRRCSRRSRRPPDWVQQQRRY